MYVSVYVRIVVVWMYVGMYVHTSKYLLLCRAALLHGRGCCWERVCLARESKVFYSQRVFRESVDNGYLPTEEEKKSNSNTFSVRYHSTFLSFFHSYLHHSAQHTQESSSGPGETCLKVWSGLVRSGQSRTKVMYSTVR